MASKTRLNTILFFIIIVSITPLKAQGLRFYGNKESIGQRTTLSLFKQGHDRICKQYIDIQFDLKIQDYYTFGYLFHLVDNNNNLAYSFTYTYLDKASSSFKFNMEGTSNLITLNFSNSAIESQWIPIRLHVDLASEKCWLSVANKTKQSTFKSLRTKEIKPSFWFGRRENLVDVPPFMIRNLTIERDQQLSRFPLNESKGNEVHDDNGEIVGTVINPCWLINESYHWKKKITICSNTILGSKFNATTQHILLLNQDSLFAYDVGKNQLLAQKYANKMPFQMLLGTNFIDETTNKIYAYEVHNLPHGSTTIAALNVPLLTWHAIGKAQSPMQLHHHDGFWDKKRERYILFGGFGNRRYSKHFLSYNQKADRWDTLQFKGDNICPRFFSSIAASANGDVIYIYGGVGNESGDQSVGHNYYNDLYKIDLKNQIIKKQWSNRWNEKLVPGERMILSPDEKHLYVLRYAEYNESTFLQLYSMSIANGAMQKLGDSIPYISKSIASNVTLYYSDILHEFYCITHEFDDITHHVTANIYVLSTPPVDKAAVEFYVSCDKKAKPIFIWITILGCILVLAYIMTKRIKKKRKREYDSSIEINTPQPNTGIVITNASRILAVDTKETLSEKQKNSVYLFGIFTLYGKSGRDISYLFSKKLKQIFIYILLNSEKEGVNSTLLNNLFWPEKTEDKARNIKGVTMSNLRKALTEIEGVELIYEKGFFKIVIKEPCYCDYDFLKKALAKQSLSCDTLLSICERGQLLECIEQDLFNKYKREIEDIILAILPQELSVFYNKNEFEQVLRICAVLLKLDPLHEPALLYSIYSYNRLSDFEKSFKIYAKFTTEYRNAMGHNYPRTLEALMQEDV